MSRPDNAIQEIKEKRNKEIETLRRETEQIADEIEGNPKIVDAIKKLERRIEMLEDKVE